MLHTIDNENKMLSLIILVVGNTIEMCSKSVGMCIFQTYCILKTIYSGNKGNIFVRTYIKQELYEKLLVKFTNTVVYPETKRNTLKPFCRKHLEDIHASHNVTDTNFNFRITRDRGDQV